MKKYTKIKYIWIALSFLLLALPVFIPSTTVDVINICIGIAVILSYPLNQLVGWMFFYTGFPFYTIGAMYLMLFVFTVLAYIQWLVIIPRLARFAREKIFTIDVQINLSAKIEPVKTLPAAKTEFYSVDFQGNWYDEQKRTPVERVFEDKNE